MPLEKPQHVRYNGGESANEKCGVGHFLCCNDDGAVLMQSLICAHLKLKLIYDSLEILDC